MVARFGLGLGIEWAKNVKGIEDKKPVIKLVMGCKE